MGILPLLWNDSQKGQRSTMMIHSKYADLLDGVSYCDRLVWNGNPNEVGAAIAHAKTLADDVRCTQIVGNTQDVREVYLNAGSEGAQTDCFQKDSWRVGGFLDLWKAQLPLIFDRRDKDREMALIAAQGANFLKGSTRRYGAHKYILIAVGGGTSPFPYKKLLLELIKGRFIRKTTNSQIIDLDKIKAERIYDLLAIYEKAYCLIASDSALLHLAHACPNLPVVALAQDKPSLWHGAAWRANYIFYVRYSDFHERAVDMLDAIDSIRIPGSFFVNGELGNRIVHVYSNYGDRSESAMVTWQDAYKNGHWISTPSEYGVFGKDSVNVLNDDKRTPFVKEVIRLGIMRAKDDDLICLTRADTCFSPNLSERLLESKLAFAKRVIRDKEGDTYHPASDLFVFSKRWWKEHQGDYPNFILDKAQHWSRVLTEMIKRDGGVELNGAVYQSQ